MNWHALVGIARDGERITPADGAKIGPRVAVEKLTWAEFARFLNLRRKTLTAEVPENE